MSITVTIPQAPEPALMPNRQNPITTRKSAIIRATKYDGEAVLQTPLAVVARHRRTPDMATVRLPLVTRKYPHLVALIDEADLPWLSKYRWYPSQSANRRTFYVKTCLPSGERLYLHRLILGAGKGAHVDHIDGDGLNNSRSNLRICSKSQNAANAHYSRIGAASKYRGVSWHKQSGGWKAQISTEGRQRHIGMFDSEIEAALAYDREALAHFGEFARLNFSGDDAV